MKIRIFLAAAVALPGLSLVAASAPTQEETPVISREVLFGHPDRISPKLSPDGTRLSFLAPVNGVINVWEGPSRDPDQARAVTHDTGQGIRIYQWAYTNEHILFLQDDDGHGHMRLYRVSLGSGDVTALTPSTSTAPGKTHTLTARIQHVSHKYAEDIVIGLNDRDPRRHDLYVCNLETGELIELQRNEGFVEFYTDDDYSVRMVSRLLDDGGIEYLVMNDEGEWQTFMQVPMDDLFTTGVIGFDKTGDALYMIDSRGRDTAVLKKFDLDTGTGQTLAKNRDADISGGVLIHPTQRTVQAASATYKRRTWYIIDTSV